MNYFNLFDSGNVRSLTKSTATLGIMGAVLGGTIAAIENTYEVTKGEKSTPDAIAKVAKETIGSGISAATATATVGALGVGGLVGLVSFAAVATISKGFIDSILYGKAKPSTSKG